MRMISLKVLSRQSFHVPTTSSGNTSVEAALVSLAAKVVPALSMRTCGPTLGFPAVAVAAASPAAHSAVRRMSRPVRILNRLRFIGTLPSWL